MRRTSSQPARSRLNNPDRAKSSDRPSATAFPSISSHTPSSPPPPLPPPSALPAEFSNPLKLKYSPSLLSLASPKSPKLLRFPRKRAGSLSAQNAPRPPAVSPIADPPPRPLRNPARSKLSRSPRPSTAPSESQANPPWSDRALVTSPPSPMSSLPVRPWFFSISSLYPRPFPPLLPKPPPSRKFTMVLVFFRHPAFCRLDADAEEIHQEKIAQRPAHGARPHPPSPSPSPPPLHPPVPAAAAAMSTAPKHNSPRPTVPS
ncbi:hypothetical protein EW146_g4252 [Bondarzewia mesenterica]|uniref:Uncharacterized protein n=1 Tax=Bondarzewia mesenterica TaxID=1095465 RepID=A0A4S4LW65_9AGAM|nr:hypothetical protein EW146_g4252 [Bondarzewia mesenterica]